MYLAHSISPLQKTKDKDDAFVPTFKCQCVSSKLDQVSTKIHAFVRRNSTRIILSLCMLFVFFNRGSIKWETQPSAHRMIDHSNTFESIPHKIWQIYFGYSKLGELGDMVRTWPTVNQDLKYTLVSNEGGNDLARKHYGDRPEVLETFLNLTFPVLRSDLLRYMILESEGGVYSDLDTAALKPFTAWVPENMKTQVKAIIGIEYDQGSREPYIGMPMPLQFCQWTMASVPEHPIMKKAVEAVVEGLQNFAAANGTSIAELEPSDEEVVSLTGPQLWTTAVLQSLSEATKTEVDASQLTDLIGPKLFGDILVLPVNAFGEGQPHSNSWNEEGHAPDALVRHMWKGSWKHGWRG